MINTTQRSKKNKKQDKKKDNLRRSRQSSVRLQETIKRPENTSKEEPKDELTIDAYRSDKQACIDKMLDVWATRCNHSGKTCSLCECREQNPECAGNLCKECCDPTRVQNYKCSACCETVWQAVKIKNVRDDIKIMNQTNNRQSFAELGKTCSYNEDNEDLDCDEDLIPKAE